MRKTREILRLKWGQGLSGRSVARSVGVSPSTVSDCVARAQVLGLRWPLDPELDDAALEAMLYPPPEPSTRARVAPDWAYIHRELRRKGVTRLLLWQEYKRDHVEDGYRYSRFCELYDAYRKRLDVVLRQEHRAGEKMFVDFSGDGIDIVDPHTGEVREAPLFVAVLGASSFTYAEVVPSEQLRWWIQAHVHAFSYFGGVAEVTVPDNTRTAVLKACRYEPDLNPTYRDLAEHYGTAVVPARPYKPRDKAKVESGVLVAQRWIIAALRNHTFFSVEQANQAVAEKLEELNDRSFQKLETTRRELFNDLERPALKPLPATPYEFAEWTRPKVNIDYHVEVDRHWYSVPHQLVRERVEVRRTTHIVEIFFKGRRVASHRRSFVPGKHSTTKEHMPRSHREHLEWTPSRIIGWASKTGPSTAELVEQILVSKPHPEQGYRSCLGILRLSKRFGPERLEAAAARALSLGACSYKTVKSILQTGLDRQQDLPGTKPRRPLPNDHANLRGPDYYH